MNKRHSTGTLSQLDWGSVDLQVQTEVRYELPSTLTTILVADGVTVSRVTKPWVPDADTVLEEQKIREYHQRLTRALVNLSKRKWIDIEELADFAERLVSAAMKFADESLTADIMAILQGAHWSALVSKNGTLVETTPSSAALAEWLPVAPHIFPFISSCMDSFGLEKCEDVSFKIGDDYILFVPKQDDYLMVRLEGRHLPGARRLISRIIGSA